MPEHNTTMIVGGRGVGKTHRLLEELSEDENNLYLCASRLSSEHPRRMFVGMLMERNKMSEKDATARAIRQIKSVSDPRRGMWRNMYVDNLTWVLAGFLDCAPNEIKMMADNVLVETPQGKKFELWVPNPYTGG